MTKRSQAERMARWEARHETARKYLCPIGIHCWASWEYCMNRNEFWCSRCGKKK